jgi:hypothetical protein
MHAVVIRLTVKDREAAGGALREQVLPQVTAARGFVAGYWLSMPGGNGLSISVFDSQDAARTVAEQAQPPGDFVSFDSVEVGEVVASA